MASKRERFLLNDLALEADAAAALLMVLNTEVEGGLDDDTAHDTIEGETNLIETIDRALDELQEATWQAKALKEREQQVQARRKRVEAKAAVIRAGLAQVLRMIENKLPTPNIRAPLATITLRETGRELVVTSEADIPAAFWRDGKPTLDKAALKAALLARLDDEDSEVIEGEGPDLSPSDLDEYGQIKGATLSDVRYTVNVRWT